MYLSWAGMVVCCCLPGCLCDDLLLLPRSQVVTFFVMHGSLLSTSLSFLLALFSGQ